MTGRKLVAGAVNGKKGSGHSARLLYLVQQFSGLIADRFKLEKASLQNTARRCKDGNSDICHAAV